MEMLSAAELRALDAYRLDNDLTYRALAEEMNDAGCYINRATLNLLLAPKAKAIKPHDRNIHKIRKFLRHIAAKQRRRVRARRASLVTATAAAAE